MRIHIDFNKKPRSLTTIALEKFVNYHLIGINHGLTFEAIFITLIEKPKKNQNFKRRFLYKKYAEISLAYNFNNYNELNIIDFQNIFNLITENIHIINEIKIEKINFKYELLKNDLNSLKPILPNNISELKIYISNTEKLDREILLKRMNCRIEQRKSNKRDLTKRVVEFRAYNRKNSPLLILYLNKIVGILNQKLKSIPIYSPKYSRIYWSIAHTLEDAMMDFPLEDWYEYAYLDFDDEEFEKIDLKFKKKDVGTKIIFLAKKLFNSLYQLCEIDHLNKKDFELMEEELIKELNNFLNQSDNKQQEDELNNFYQYEKNRNFLN